MFRSYLVRASIAAACLALAAFPALADGPAATPVRPPVSAFGNLPLVSQVRLSADGNYLAMIQSLKGKPVAVITQPFAPKGTPPAVVEGSDMLIAGLHWTRANRLILVTKSNDQLRGDLHIRTRVRAVAVDPDGKNSVLLLNNAPLGFNPNSASVVDINASDPNHILMMIVMPKGIDIEHQVMRNRENRDYFKMALFLVDTRTGKGEEILDGTGDTGGWMTDGHGKPIVRVDQTDDPLTDHLFIEKDGHWVEVAKFDATGDGGTDLEGLAADGKTLVFRKRNEKTLNGLVLRDYTDNSEKPLFYAPENDVDGAISDPWTQRVIGVSYTDDQARIKYFDPFFDELQRAIEAAFPGKVALPVSWDAERNRFVIVVEGPQTPPTYYLFDRKANRMLTIAKSYPTLKETDLGEMKPYPYKARDGLDIHAYITLPPGKEAKNLPAIVMPHGGPDARDSIGFDWWAQFMANRGYAVLQPNFRGSAGYGKNFTDKGRLHWGLEMQDDVSDGVKKMIADGIADPKRVCIVGASYGGYATLAGAAFSPDLYACAASWAGVSDLSVMLTWERKTYGPYSQVFSFWQTRIGDVNKDMDRILATSPARHADKVKSPLLLMHGDGDTTVPVEQSEIMDKAMKDAGKQVEFVRFGDRHSNDSENFVEDHYLNLAPTRIKMLERLEKFLADHIGN
jgi:dipeptidyl aminopeptidase/acylaminoacyl peptidase